MESKAFLLIFFAAVIAIILLIGIIKGKKKGLKWILFLLMLGIVTYLMILAEILRIP